MFAVIALIGVILIIAGVILHISDSPKEAVWTCAAVGIALLIPSALAANQLVNQQKNAFKLVKAGFINPIPTDGGDFGVSVSGVQERVKLVVHGDQFYIVDLSGTQREVKSPADVREIVGK